MPNQAAGACPVHEREWQPSFPVDVRLTLGVQGRGRSDPTFRVDEAGAIWRTSLTPDGPGTIRVLPGGGVASAARPVRYVSRPGVSRWEGPVDGGAPGLAVGVLSSVCAVVRAQAWGPGGPWLLDALPGTLGLYDDISGFDPLAVTAPHSVIRDTAARYPGLRIGRTGLLMEALVPAILEQKVVLLEAHRAWRILLAKFGTEPPGPAPHGMRVFPPPAVWRRIPSWDWHRAGVEGVRARTIISAATVAGSLERLLAASHEEADRKLRTLSGIGIWTSAEARQRAAGDPDAVSVGDAHLSNIVGWVLAGRDRTDDAGMLELLAPYQGHRYRVTRLIALSGRGAPQRRGPRMPVRDYRRF